MAHRKAAGSTKNTRDSGPQYLGIKRSDGSSVSPGVIIVRQRGTKYEAGKNVKVGRDYTLFAGKEGTVSFRNGRKKRFDGKVVVKKFVDVT